MRSRSCGSFAALEMCSGIELNASAMYKRNARPAPALSWYFRRVSLLRPPMLRHAQVARAFNLLYSLRLTTRGEMELAYTGEVMTPSKCGAQCLRVTLFSKTKVNDSRG
jgi:hypothetical protein